MIADVIFPCLNEAPALPWILGRMPAGFRPIVVDNCPTDGSSELKRSLRERPQLRGFGVDAGAPGAEEDWNADGRRKTS